MTKKSTRTDAIATERTPDARPRRLVTCFFCLVFLTLCSPDVAPRTSHGAEGEGADGDARPGFRDDVLQRIDQLDADEISRRQAAERSLIEAGNGVLPLLPDTDDPRLSAEAAERIKRIKKTLLQKQTRAELADVKVELRDVETLGEALEAISRDSGVEFDFAGDKTSAIDAVDTPLAFWHAVDLVLDQAELDINFYAGDRETLALIPRQEGRRDRVGTAAYTGVYRLEPTAVTARRSLIQPDLSSLNVTLDIAWEPRVTPIGLTIPVDQVTVELDNGQTLRPQESSETIDIATASDIAFSEFFLPLELPGGNARKIERLGGVIEALLPGKRKRFELDLVGPQTRQTLDAMTVRVEQTRPNGPLHEVRVSVKLENPDRSLESHRQWIFDNEVFVVAADGGRIDHLGFQAYRQASDGVSVGYLFDLGGNLDRQKLIYRSPTAVMNTKVPFVLQDIELP